MAVAILTSGISADHDVGIADAVSPSPSPAPAPAPAPSPAPADDDVEAPDGRHSGDCHPQDPPESRCAPRQSSGRLGRCSPHRTPGHCSLRGAARRTHIPTHPHRHTQPFPCHAISHSRPFPIVAVTLPVGQWHELVDPSDALVERTTDWERRAQLRAHRASGSDTPFGVRLDLCSIAGLMNVCTRL